MVKNNNLIENQLLLGLLPLLGGTINLTTGFIIGLSVLIISLIMKIIYSGLQKFTKSDSYWILLIAIGLSLSYSFYIIIPALSPYLSEFVNKYLLLVGVTPIIYSECVPQKGWNLFFKNKAVFFIMMIITAAIREFLAQGTILESNILESPIITLADGPIGAFAILGCLGLISYLLIGEKNPSGQAINEEGAN